MPHQPCLRWGTNFSVDMSDLLQYLQPVADKHDSEAYDSGYIAMAWSIELHFRRSAECPASA